MHSPRFFCPQALAPGALLALPENAARHAVRVLRLTAGQAITLFDGRGGEYAARIAAVRKDEVSAEVLDWRAAECESPLSIRLVQALQAGDKMDLTVQKAVELGVAAIQPVASRRSVVRLDGERALRRVEHWRGVAASACEQCGRNRVPAVHPLLPLRDWLQQPAAAGELRLSLAPEAATGLRQLDRPAGRVTVLTGPEGGLTAAELAAAAAAGFRPLRLGPRVLRTETAAVALLAAMQVLWGDF